MDSEHDSAKKIEEGDLGDAIANSRKIRKGWTESFRLMAANGDDKLVIEAYLSTEYDEEWDVYPLK